MQLSDTSLRRVARPEEVKACGAFLLRHGTSLEDAFRNLDSAGGSMGHINLNGFMTGMVRLGYDAEKAEGVFHAVDTQHTGLISLQTFLMVFNPKGEGGRMESRRSDGGRSRSGTPRIDSTIDTLLSWPESLEGSPTDIDALQQRGLPPPAPSGDAMGMSSGSVRSTPGSARSVADISSQVERLRSDLQVERTERSVELKVLRERALPELLEDVSSVKSQLEDSRKQIQVDLAVFRGALEAKVGDLQNKLREVQEDTENCRGRIQALEANKEDMSLIVQGMETQSLASLRESQSLSSFKQQADGQAQTFDARLIALESRLQQDLELISQRVQNPFQGDMEAENHSHRLAALEGTLQAELENIAAKFKEVEARQDGSVIIPGTTAARTMLNLEAEVEVQTAEQRRALDEVAAEQKRALDEVQRALEARLAEQNNELGRLSADVDAMAKGNGQHLEVEDCLRELAALRSDMDARERLVRDGLEAAVEGQRAELVALRTQLQTEVQTMALEQRATESAASSVLGLQQLEAGLQQVDDFCRALEERLQSTGLEQQSSLSSLRRDLDNMAEAKCNGQQDLAESRIREDMEASVIEQRQELAVLRADIQEMSRALEQRARQPSKTEVHQREAGSQQLDDFRLALEEAVRAEANTRAEEDFRIESSCSMAAEAKLAELRRDLDEVLMAQRQRAAEPNGPDLLRLQELEAKFQMQRDELKMIRADVDQMATDVHKQVDAEPAAPNEAAIQQLEARWLRELEALRTEVATVASDNLLAAESKRALDEATFEQKRILDDVAIEQKRVVDEVQKGLEAKLAEQNSELGRLSAEVDAMALEKRAAEPAASAVLGLQELEAKYARQQTELNMVRADVNAMAMAEHKRVVEPAAPNASAVQPVIQDLEARLRRERANEFEALRAEVATVTSGVQNNVEARWSREIDELRSEVAAAASGVQSKVEAKIAEAADNSFRSVQEVGDLQSKMRELLEDAETNRDRIQALEAGKEDVSLIVQGLEAKSLASLQDCRQQVDVQAETFDARLATFESTVQQELELISQRVQSPFQGDMEAKWSRELEALRTEVATVASGVQSTVEAVQQQPTSAIETEVERLRAAIERQREELLALRTELRAEVQTMAIPQPAASETDLERLKDGLKQLEEIRHSLEEALQTEARTRADEDRRVERACNLDLKAGLGVLAREMNSHAAGLDEVRKNIGLEREERINRQQELSGTVHDSLHAMISKLDVMTPSSSTGCVSNPVLLATSPRGSLTGSIPGGLKSSTSAGGLRSGQSTPRVSDRGHAFVSQIDSMGVSVRSPRRQSRQASPSQPTRGISLTGSNHVRGTSARVRTPSLESRAASVESSRRMVSQGLPRHPTENGLATNSNHTSSQVLQMIDALQEEVLLRRQMEAGRQSVGRQPNRVIPQGRAFPSGKLLGGTF